MSALICGSFAYDNIMVFPDRFRNHILPDKIHILNVSFLVPELRREFGGCAGNIAYNLKQLGGNPLPMGTVGSDFGPYAQWLERCGIDASHLTVIEEAYTAQAFITTDLDDNQITAFHPGAMNFAHHNRVEEAVGVKIGIVAPDGREGMIEHAAQFAEAGIPFIFDPGQGLPMFDGEELKAFIHQATWVTVNDYEWQLMNDRTGWDEARVLEQVEALVITRGGEGAEVHTREGCLKVPAARTGTVLDPTGCGDAFRAGLLYGLERGLSWEVTARLAAVLGAIKIEHHGTQNHQFDLEIVLQRYRESYGEPPAGLA